ncbi:polysaccharide pyruvyl transferase family protein [Methyloglobulus sp.]|uniref:polysaccharide pyruvyl transferase family protein n=1 Tax=Methyloglobulus sp. TaxID=2518622 RepID=UPI0032B72406
MTKTNINDYLKQYANEEAIYIPNPGNAGDSLIAHAAHQILDRAGINFHEGDIKAVYEGRVVFYGGGGNLVGLYKNALRFIENNYNKVKKLVVLPHSIQAYPEMLAGLGDNVDLFCRENDSYQYVTQHVTKANVFTADDLVFGVDIKKTISDGDKLFSFTDQFLSRNTKRCIRTAIYGIKNSLSAGVLNSFRMDDEKSDIAIPFNNIDLSQAFATDNMSRLYSHETSYRVFKYIDKFKTVNTNRLHVAIASTLLGKEVNFYKNSYNKNYSVYDFSMRDNYKNVTFLNK